MSIMCAMGFHSWTFCKCRRCGKTKDKAHDWHGCKCSKCGKTRDDGHQWRRCVCLTCGKSKADPIVRLIDEFRQKVVSREINREEGRCWDVQMCYERFARTGAYELLKTAYNGVLYISQFYDQTVVQNILMHTESVQELILWHAVEPQELNSLKERLKNPDCVPDVIDQIYSKCRQRL